MKQQLEDALQHQNVKAFLEVIRKAEGTDYPNGYRYMFGSRPGHENLFEGYDRHPGKVFPYTNKEGKEIKTSAAGAYQIIIKTWTVLKQRLGLADFSPHSQDLAALELIRETGALPLIEAGQFDLALNKVRKIWASLPGSGAHQPERSLAQVRTWYQEAGGTIV